MKEYKQIIKTTNRSSFIMEGDLFLDIETLGLSPKTAPVYLIGLGYYAEEGYEIHQIFAEREDEEGEILQALFPFLQNASRILTFNGEAFDLPFLTNRSHLYHLPFSYKSAKITWEDRSLESFDILKAVRSLRRILQFPHYNQRALEDFLGIKRDGDLDGGQLIRVYRAFEQDSDPIKLRALLDHNAFDVAHMPGLLDLLTYRNILTTEYGIDSFTYDDKGISFTASSQLMLPAPLSIHKTGIHLQFDGQRLQMFIPLTDGKMRYYLPNPKDYVRLKADGQLLPRALASSLDSSSYEKVDRDTCYQEVTITDTSLTKEYLSRYLKQILRQLK